MPAGQTARKVACQVIDGREEPPVNWMPVRLRLEQGFAHVMSSDFPTSNKGLSNV